MGRVSTGSASQGIGGGRRLQGLQRGPGFGEPPGNAGHHRHRLLVELLAVAKASRGKEEWGLDLSPVGEDFDPEAEL